MQAEHSCHKHPSPLILAEGDGLQLLLALYGHGTLHGTGDYLLPLIGHIVLLLLQIEYARTHSMACLFVSLCSWRGAISEKQ